MNATTSDTLDRLGHDCVRHCRDETALLREALVVAADLDSALERGQTDEWRTLLSKAQTLPGRLEAIRPRRQQLRGRLHEVLGGHDASFRQLAARLSGGVGALLLQARDELTQSWESLLRLQQRQTAFVRICGDFMQRLVADVAGATPVGPRYGPQGRPVASAIGAVFAAKG